MQTVIETRVSGEFLGYEYDRLYTLEDGSVWRQTGWGSEPVYRDRPVCRLLYAPDRGLYWLDVEGTSSVVQVERVGRKRWKGPGPY